MKSWIIKKLDANHSMISDSDGLLVVPRMITEPGTQSEKNAQAIVAVPDLIGALVNIVQAWPAHGSDVNNPMMDAVAERALVALRLAGIEIRR